MKILMFFCMAAFVATQGVAAHTPDVLDDLMPVPAVIKRTGEAADVSVLQKVKVQRATVPDAPVATADEAYVLEIGSGGVTIRASSPRGERWARVTLDQLMCLARGYGVPCCRITDWPRLKWRGFMLDSVRNYLPPEGIKDVIDMMSRYKLNLFHWHITENYAWRLESKLFPELQSERAFLHRHKGKFYTQEEFKDIVDYAYSHGVCVMPEFDFPGHALAFRRAFGFKTMSEPGVAEKGAALFAELCSLAPKEKMPFIHMGTDEVFKRDMEGTPRETLELMAKAIADGDRTMVSWVPGENYDTEGPRINMLWTDKVSPDSNPGAYFDAIGMYIEDYDPFELLSVAVYHKAARWHDAGDKNQGAIFCAWHDGFAGLPYENLLRNQPVFPSCVLFGNAYWRGRDIDHPEFRKCLPYAGNPLLAEAVDIERRVIAQRDRALCDIRHPFHFLRQTDMRWRMSAADGTVLATDIAQATVSPARFKDASGKAFAVSNDVVVLETWIKSPESRTVGAWIGFINLSRDHGFVYSVPMPNIGEWNRFGATAELNGEKIAPPKWKRPGLKKGNPIPDWTPAWTLYEADEEPFTDQEYYMREPTRIQLRKGWNHVKLVLPNPMLRGGKHHRWSATFIPVEGPTDHPREVPGLEYSSTPPAVAAGFEKIALVDSLDFATFCDPETSTGNTAIIDHVLGTGATAVYWRNQSADWPRYPSREMDRRQMAHGLDKRRRANWNLVYGWLRLDRGRDVKNLMADAFSQLRARGVNTGIHLTFEETHCRIAWTFSPWNLDHPQYWVRLRDDIPYAGRCSFFYDEVLAHKMRLVDELLEMDGDTILLDFYRAGWWTPAYEYVPGMCDEFRKTYGEEPPKDAKDPRWLKLVGKYMERYLRAIRARIDAAPRKKRFMVCLSVCSAGLPRPAPEMLPDGAAYDRLCLENLALDWKKLAADGVFDAVAVASAVIAENERDPWGKIAMVYDHVRANCGKAALYGHCSMYDYQQCGIARCAKAAGISQAEAARKLLEVARTCGAKGVLMECVDPGNYPPDVMEAIRSFK